MKVRHMPTCDYTITYTDNSKDDHVIKLSKWEDAEKVAHFIATMPLYTNVVLTDGYSNYNHFVNSVTISFV
jgi:hypothetical protein